MSIQGEVRGSVRRVGERSGAVRMEVHCGGDPRQVWAALTTPERLAMWVAEVTGDARLRGEVCVAFTSGWTGTGRVEVCEPSERLVVTLEPGSEEESTVEALLTTGSGPGVDLVIEERGLPLDELDGHAAGWQAHVEDLRAHLEGEARRPWRERCIELRPRYADAVRAASVASAVDRDPS